MERGGIGLQISEKKYGFQPRFLYPDIYKSSLRVEKDIFQTY